MAGSENAPEVLYRCTRCEETFLTEAVRDVHVQMHLYPDPSIYVINGFFLAMRNKFIAPGASIVYFLVEWDETKLSWANFRAKVLGATDPAKAQQGSLRYAIRTEWKKLGLAAEPDIGDNGVHGSASPFEAFVERCNWVGATVEGDPYGRALIQAGVPAEAIKEWQSDPQVQYAGAKRSLFDLLEDLNCSETIERARAIAGVRDFSPITATKNQAFVFIKPHAVTDVTIAVVKRMLQQAGLTVVREGRIGSTEIEKEGLIDAHYSAIASKALQDPPAEMSPSPQGQQAFMEKFGISWEKAVTDGLVFNAKDGCEKLGISEAELTERWARTQAVGNLVKLGGGFYAGFV